MFYLGVMLLGGISLSKLEVNLLPEMEFPRLTVVTLFPNAAPEEVENLVTRPLSEAVGTVSGLESISSESLEGISFVTLQFQWGVNVDFAVMEVREKTDLVRGLLPEDAGRPIVTRFDPNDAPFIEIAVTNRGLPKNDDLRHFLRNEVKLFLDRVNGVAMVELAGGRKKEIQVNVDPDRLSSYGLTLDQLGNAISSTNLNSPAGHITSGATDVLVRTLGEYRSIADIKETVVGGGDGAPVQLYSVAEVIDGYQERTGIARHNGKECVLLSLYKESGKNTVATADNVRRELETIRTQFGSQVDIRLVYDESRFIVEAIENIVGSLVTGGVLAFVALLLILRNLRSPLVLLTVLPISVLTSFMLMYFSGLTLNIMSLGGLALGIGMLFDAGNVTLSAIDRHAQAGAGAGEAALRGALEVSGSVTAAVLTTVIVFVPIVFLESVVGVVFAEMALTITYSLLVSLVVSLTLIPMLSAQRAGWMRWDAQLQKQKWIQAAAAWETQLSDAYARRLAQIISQPRRVYIAVAALFMVAVVLTPLLQREFVPKVDAGEFSIAVEMPRGASLEATEEAVEQIERLLLTESEVANVISRIGYDEDQILSRKGGDVGVHLAHLRVTLKEDRSIETQQFLERMRKNLRLRAEIKVTFEAGGDILAEILSPESKAVTVEIAGEDLDALSDFGNRLQAGLRTLPGITDVQSSMEQKAREYHVSFDSERMANARLTHADIAALLQTAVRGDVFTRLRVGDDEVDIRVRLNEGYRDSIEELRRIQSASPSGGAIRIDQIAEIKESEGFGAILRSGGDRVNRITADIEGGNQNSVRTSVASYIQSFSLPEGYKIRIAGEEENIGEAFQELSLAFLLSVVLIYLLLAAQFESLRTPGVMLATIPLILIGAAPALFLTGKSLNVSSFTGFILLVGIVVDNAALYYEYVHLLQSEGRSLDEALIESGRIVLRPILMNNSTTLLGLLPVALELGAGVEFQSPMAITVVSGLIASVFLSLFVVPVAFSRLLRRRASR